MYADGLKPPSRMSVLVVTAVRPPSGFRCHVRALGWGPGVRLHWLMTWWKHDEGYPGFFATIPGMYTFLNRFLYSAFTLGSHSNHVFSVHTGYWFSTRSIHELVVHSFGVLNMTLRSQWEEPVGKRCCKYRCSMHDPFDMSGNCDFPLGRGSSFHRGKGCP